MSKLNRFQNRSIIQVNFHGLTQTIVSALFTILCQKTLVIYPLGFHLMVLANTSFGSMTYFTVDGCTSPIHNKWECAMDLCKLHYWQDSCLFRYNYILKSLVKKWSYFSLIMKKVKLSWKDIINKAIKKLSK